MLLMSVSILSRYQYQLSRSLGNLSNSSSDHSGHNPTPGQQISPIARELGAILKVGLAAGTKCDVMTNYQEIKVITDKIKDDEISDSVKADWKFAAMVLDRMCLFFFSAFTLVATLSVLAVAPHIIVY